MAGARVVVAGAGPAGCAAARALASAGHNVLLCEKGQRGRDKACGDALVSSAVELVADHLGTYDFTHLGGWPFDRIDLTSGSSCIWRVPVRVPTGWLVPRAKLDQSLRDALKDRVAIRYGVVVRDVWAEANHVRIELGEGRGASTRLECDAVVLALGAANSLARRACIDGAPLGAVSISRYMRGFSNTAPVFDFDQGCRPGYRWMFPMAEDVTNIGVCLLTGALGRELKGQGRALLRCNPTAVHLGKWRGGYSTMWSERGETWHLEGGVVTCGDAAGLVDPINGEGITAALLSGHEAGRAVTRYLRDKRDPSQLTQYSEWVRDTFGARYRLSGLRDAWNRLCGSRLIPQSPDDPFP